MTVPDFGGCLWPVDPACLTDEWLATDPTVRTRSLAMASVTLERLTGHRVSNCPVTVRPCQGTACCISGTPWASAGGFYPYNWNGSWFNCACGANCICSAACQVTLPPPVTRVTEVLVGGSVVDPATYRIDNGNLLTWTGTGICPFPRTQDLAKPTSAAGTFAVTYLNAYPVDSLGAYAAAVLAMEFARACQGNTCRLPNGVTMIVRQGVTMEIANGAFPEGLTGISEVDTYIALWNPTAMQRQSTVYSPDRPRMRMTTGGSA